MDGYVKLHRKLMESPIFGNQQLLKVWVWCLMKAAYTRHECILGNRKVTLEPGQFIFGRFTCAEQLEISPSSLYRSLALLQELGSLDIETRNGYSIITLRNWEVYQSDSCPNGQRLDSDWTANEHETDTNKKGKKGKKEKNPSVDQLLSLLDGWEMGGEMREALVEFVQYRNQGAPMTELALAKARDRLIELSGGDGGQARAIVNQSIVSGWKGLFQVRGNGMPAREDRYERL